MFNKALVPLDGSAMAEHALPCVEHLAGQSDLEVILLHVDPQNEAGSGHGGRWTDRAHSYLAFIASVLAESGIQAKTWTRTGQPGQQIIEAAEDKSVNLIVMSSHGHGHLPEQPFGPVADYVLRAAPVPVLLVPAPVSGPVPPGRQGPPVNVCHHCGRRVYGEAVAWEDRCSRCQAYLKVCGNCTYFDGARCVRPDPYAEYVYPAMRCPRAEFRKFPSLLH